jgi:hypothetical protein
MKPPRKPKSQQGLLQELSKPLRDFVADFRLHGKSALEQVRERSPEKYLELSTKLLPLVMAFAPTVSGFAACKTQEEVGAALLKSVGVEEDLMTPALIEEAVKVKNDFLDHLEAIAKRQLGQLQ